MLRARGFFDIDSLTLLLEITVDTRFGRSDVKKQNKCLSPTNKTQTHGDKHGVIGPGKCVGRNAVIKRQAHPVVLIFLMQLEVKEIIGEVFVGVAEDRRAQIKNGDNQQQMNSQGGVGGRVDERCVKCMHERPLASRFTH